MINSKTIAPLPAALLTLLLALLSGCAETPEKKTAAPILSAAQQLQLQQAEQLQAGGQLAGAAALYEQLAAGADPTLADGYLLRAADLLMRSGDPEGAAELLPRIRREWLAPTDAFLAALVEAEILLARSLPAEALPLLATTPGAAVPAELAARYRRDRAEAFRLEGDLVNSARELAELDLLPAAMEAPLDVQLRLVRTLTALPPGVLEPLRAQTTGLFAGWLDLARALQAYAVAPDPAAPAIVQWRETHPNHPALPLLIGHYLDGLQQEMSAFSKIAVLLPTRGRYAAAATALMDGLMSAYYADRTQAKPTIAVYDSSESADVWPLLQQAVAEGAQAVIGPLQKEAVDQLVPVAELSIPVLALNRVTLDSVPPANLFQFGLAPEDEARDAADKAWNDGAVTALALVPEGEWGERLLASFRDRWESLGGTLAGYGTYDPAKSDFSDTLRLLLHLDKSEERQQALVRTLGQRLEFEPHRRQDTGALFLAANSGNARSLWPQLQFNHAADLPVYTTSHIFTGHFSATDLDLVGLTFADMPWMLPRTEDERQARQALPAELAQRSGALARLYAMGMDSYRLLPALGRLREFPAARLSGATGLLSVDELNRVHRQLTWAHMSDQGPQVLEQGPGSDAPAPPPAAAPVSHAQGR